MLQQGNRIQKNRMQIENTELGGFTYVDFEVRHLTKKRKINAVYQMEFQHEI